MTIDFNTSFILPNGFDLGGVTSWSVEIAERLASKGWKTSLIRHIDRFVSEDTWVHPDVNLLECTHHIHPNYRYLFRKDINEYVKSYNQVLPAVLIPNYSYGAYAACACLAVDSADKLRVIGMAHTDHADYYQLLVRFESIIHVFVAVSHEIATHLAMLLPHRKHDIVHRPCGVPVMKEISRPYSGPDQSLKIIYAGRLSERQKRVSDIVKLASALSLRNVDFELQIYGSGRDKQYLESLVDAQKKHIRKRILIGGHVTARAMASLYRAADIFVMVSEYEGTSLSMLESMANGCVPVVTEVSGTSEVIIPGENGFIVPVGNVTEMADKIVWLNQDKDRLMKFGNEAIRTISDCYSYGTYVPWFEDILGEIWDKPSRSWHGNDSFSFYFPVRQFIKEAGYTLAAKPGLRWLYRFKKPMRKIVK